MTSSENLPSLEPWMSRLPFTDSWISEAYARDTETLTKALQQSLSSSMTPFQSLGGGSGSFFDQINLQPEIQTPAVSGLSGSDPETVPKRRGPVPVAAGKIGKRKSRASKRTNTTFITADPANFRQMVQQVTGVRFGTGQIPLQTVLKPEPQRASNRLQACLPTLDTSAFLLDRNQAQKLVGPAASPQQPLSPPMSFAAVDGGSAFDLDGFCGFPTLESWKVM